MEDIIDHLLSVIRRESFFPMRKFTSFAKNTLPGFVPSKTYFVGSYRFQSRRRRDRATRTVMGK